MDAYIAIDMKSFYASVECVDRHLDPLRANLLVADENRSDQTICLAVSPALKAIGVPGRPRLFEAKRAIRAYETAHNTRVEYIIAVPRMRLYEEVSASIHEIYLRYAAPEDIHVYSIDESLIYCTPYLHLYRRQAEQSGTEPAHVMAMTIIRDVLAHTGITATVGIGTNLYLSKVAMDILAKKSRADADGVRIASLDEDSYKYLLWEHKPLTDFWQIGNGKARTLEHGYMYTMGDIALRSQVDEEWFYKAFGIDAEILIDHAWGIEPVSMRDTGHKRPDRNTRRQTMTNRDTFRYCNVIKKGKPQHGKCDSFTLRHPPMPMSKRAKIFCPFDALKGFGEMIAEKERFCEKERLCGKERFCKTEQDPAEEDLRIQNEISDYTSSPY